MLPSYQLLQEDPEKPASSQTNNIENMVVPTTTIYSNVPAGKTSRTFDFDLSSLPTDVSSPDVSPMQSLPLLEMPIANSDSFAPVSGFGDSKKPVSNLPMLSINSKQTRQADLRIEIPDHPTLIVQSPKTPTLSRKLKAQSLDSDSNTSNNQADCLEVPRDVFSMPNTPKRQLPKSQIHKFGVRSHSGTNLGMDTVSTSGSNLSSFGSNQSISGSQTLKTLPEIMTLSDFSQGKTEPVRIKAKGLLERRGSNVSLTIDLGAAETRNTATTRLNTAKSVSNLNLTNIECDATKCKCGNENKCQCEVKRVDCKKCVGNLKKFQKLSTESCLCDETTNNSNCQSYKMCQYSRLGCLNYLSYMRRKSLSNENLYIGPSSNEFKKVHKKSEYPKNISSHLKNQILSEDFQLHLQNIQYLQTAGNVLSKRQLKECCKIEHLKDLHKEFWELPQNFQEKSFVSGSQSKNRYKTILPNEHSRVVLDLGPGQDNSGVEGYINANYIKGYDYTETAYIATQGPLCNTTSDLWQMVIQSNAQKLVMLTPICEKGRTKCEMYFPEKLYDKLTCGKFEINCLKISNEKSYTVRTLRVRDTSVVISDNSSESKFCCDKMKKYGIECKRLSHTRFGTESFNVSGDSGKSDEVAVLKDFDKLTVEKSPDVNKSNSYFLSADCDDVLTDDDIFMPIGQNVPPLRRGPLRSRDFKFSDDFSDILTAEEIKNIELNPIEILENDIIIRHFWYQTWPDHNQANSEEILALALDVLDLKSEAPNLYNDYSSKTSHVEETTDKGDESTKNNNEDTHSFTQSNQRKNLADCSKITESQSEVSRNQKSEEKNIPIVVHCSAGIGRTGCFLAILNGIQQLRQNLNVDILAIVCALRLNRGGMVQTAEQYELIHKVLALYGQYMDK